MKRLIFLSAAFAAALALAVPFVGEGIAASTAATAGADRAVVVVESSTVVTGSVAEPTPAAAAGVSGSSETTETTAEPTAEPAPAAPAVENAAASTAAGSSAPASFAAENPVSEPLPVAAPTTGSCPTGTTITSGAPSAVSAQGVSGTTSDDLAVFAAQFNAIRAANCLPPVTKFIYDSCMEARLFWMAESPSPNPLDAWGHMGSVRSDGVPSVGCDGNLAGGSNNTGATVATKWWDSLAHRNSLYRPGSSVAGVCIAFAMTHGGIDEPASFVRAAARWVTC
jgi:uncharacterized protein YkwD